MDYESYAEEAKFFKALNHPARLAILDILREGEACVCHLEAHLGLRQAYISQQLMILREAGLVQDRREGWNIFYRVVEPRIYPLIDAASQITTNADRPGKRSSRTKTSHPVCECPKCKTGDRVMAAQELSQIAEIS